MNKKEKDIFAMRIGTLLFFIIACVIAITGSRLEALIALAIGWMMKISTDIMESRNE